jgi:predicted dehydrogenase
VEPLRLGCLGAARIAPNALVKPAKASADAEVRAVAARDPARAAVFAERHGIPVVHRTYEEVLAGDDVDAVYNPLPNGLHAEWTIKALDAGKHVLCEKPFTANAPEAERVAAAAERSGLVVMEAFHWRYHPLATEALDIINGGELGPVRRVEAALCFPLFKRDDIRWQLDLAGGALMDAGCYPVHIVRTFAGREPRVTQATARLRSPGVDRFVQAELSFGGGTTGRVTTSMWSSSVLRASAAVTGEHGSMHILNPVGPQVFNLVTVRSSRGTRRHRVRGDSTYSYQLAAFVAAVRGGAAPLTPPADSIANMRVIDDIYRAVGLEPRRGTTD